MKKNIFKILSLISLVIVFNCSKDSEVSESQNEFSEIKVNKIFELESKTDKKLAYNLLNEHENSTRGSRFNNK